MATKTLEIKGGDKLARALADIAARLDKAKGVKVGFLEGATYPAGSDTPGLPVAQVAFWNEFGTSRAPARPFFRGAIAKHSPEWGDTLAGALKATKYDGAQALALLGTAIKDQIVTSIVETTTPPNAPSTVARKGFDKPLVDTGVMQRSVDFVVE